MSVGPYGPGGVLGNFEGGGGGGGEGGAPKVFSRKDPCTQIANCICLKLQNVFVSNYKMYLSYLAKCILLKFNYT